MNRFWTIFIIIVTYSFILAQNSKSSSAVHDLEDRVIPGYEAETLTEHIRTNFVTTHAVSQYNVRVGAEVLISDSIKILEGKRLGLIVNHTSMVKNKHLIDLLYTNPKVKIQALFSPEHGIRGQDDAGAIISDDIDTNTGLPIFSLYGKVRSPTPAMLDSVDILIFDIQDVGTRFYTYISTMGFAMQAAAKANIPFIVLDRPNPIAALHIEGFTLEAAFKSFIGLYQIPVTHGMTVGELANLIKGERLLESLENLSLRVILAEGWQRTMLWSDLRMPWVPPSPNLPSFESAVIYPGTCFFGSTLATEGRGTQFPFTQIGASWLINGRELSNLMNQKNLPGLYFEPANFTIKSIPAMTVNPRFLDETMYGIRIKVEAAAVVQPMASGVHLLHAFYHSAPDSMKKHFFREQAMLNVSGGPKLMSMIKDGFPPEDIINSWSIDVKKFELNRSKYLMYPW